MALDMSVFDSITSTDYKTNEPELLTYFENAIKEYDAGRYMGFGNHTRNFVEGTMRYLMDRIQGLPFRTINLSKILENREFRKKLNNELICLLAKNIFGAASEYVGHPDSIITEDIAKRMMTDLESFVEQVTPVINGFRDPRGLLELKYEERHNTRAIPERYEKGISATLSDIKGQTRDYSYRWSYDDFRTEIKIKNRDGNNMALTRDFLWLNQRLYLGKNITCMAVNKDNEDNRVLASNPLGPIEIEHTNVSANNPGQSGLNGSSGAALEQIKGVVEVRFSQDDSVLKAVYSKHNIREVSPTFIWLRNGEEVRGAKRFKLSVSREDIGASFICKISVPGILEGEISNIKEPYVLSAKQFPPEIDMTTVEIVSPKEVNNDPDTHVASVTPPVEANAPVVNTMPTLKAEKETETTRSLTIVRNTEEKEGLVCRAFLKAYLNPPLDDSISCIYTWSIDCRKVETVDYTNPLFVLSDKHLGKMINCQATLPGNNTTIQAKEPYKVKPEDVFEQPTALETSTVDEGDDTKTSTIEEPGTSDLGANEKKQPSGDPIETSKSEETTITEISNGSPNQSDNEIVEEVKGELKESTPTPERRLTPVGAIRRETKTNSSLSGGDGTESSGSESSPEIKVVEIPEETKQEPLDNKTVTTVDPPVTDKGGEIMQKKGFTFEKPEEVSVPIISFFDRFKGRLHYFVAPRNDLYATNDLRLLDYNSFLYTLLRENGYRRVIMVEPAERGNTFRIFTYDKVSNISFKESGRFEDFFRGKTDVGQAELRDFIGSVVMTQNDSPQLTGSLKRVRVDNQDAATEDVPEYGYQQIGTIIPEDGATHVEGKNRVIFQNFVEFGVFAALKQKIIKTAIVLPMELIKASDFFDSDVARALKNCVKNSGENIVLIVSDHKSMLSDLFKINAYEDLEPDLYKAESSIQGSETNQAQSEAIFESLKKSKRILEANERPGIDEVANLIFGKILVERDRFSGIPYEKVYSLAEYILKNCNTSISTQNTEEFKDLEHNTWFVGPLDNLNEALKYDDVVEAITKLCESDKLWGRQICRMKRLKSTSLERINGTSARMTKDGKEYYDSPSKRYSISANERTTISEKAQEDLKNLIGLKDIKEKVEQLVKAAKVNANKRKTPGEPGHYIFSGNPGTGKTEVARQMGKMLHAAGLLRSGHTVEVTKDQLVAEYVGGSGIKTRKKCEEALDGVLFIDEAYQLVNTDSSHQGVFPDPFSEEAYTTLLKFMEDYRSRLCVIAAGYPDKMEKFRTANPGMSSRISLENVVFFSDYNEQELVEILKEFARKEDVGLTDEFIEEARICLENRKRENGSDFGNAREVRNLLKSSIQKACVRISDDSDERLVLQREDAETDILVRDPEAAELAWAKLNRFIGLKNIREQLKDIIRYKQLFGTAKVDSLIFAGPPGTGKTEVATLMAGILKAEGLLKKDTFVNASPDAIKGDVVGGTEKKVQQLCKDALDGVLFIDEAYTMIDEDGSYKDQFAEIAYTTIMRFMTEHKNRIMVVFAGYENIMEVFRKANPGMARRVKVINFEPYSDDELYEILLLRAQDKEKTGNRIKVVFSDEFDKEIRNSIAVMREKMGDSFGNAGSMETLLDECIAKAGRRLPADITMKRGDTLTLEVEDIPDEYRHRQTSRTEPKVPTDPDDDPIDLSYQPLSAQMLSDLPNPYEDPDVQANFNDYCATTTVYVKNKYGRGSAHIITADGFAITCAHVIMGKESSRRPASGTVGNRDEYSDPNSEQVFFPYDVVAVRPDLDLALIKIDCEQPLRYLKLAAVGTAIKRGTKATLYGYLNGEPEVKAYECKVTSREIKRKDGGLGTIVELQTDAFPGDSGGPVVSEETGLVIGVLQGARTVPKGGTEKGSIDFMKPIDYFWKEFTQ